MSSNTFAIKVTGLGKSYKIFKKDNHRIYQFFLGERKKLYREFWAIKNVSFEIEKGDTVAILGRNGAGKSTLLQLICSTIFPTQGTIEMSGKVAALLELGAGFNGEFTGRENIYISGAIYGLSRTEIDKKFPKIEIFADIGEFIDQPVKNYSSGMFVRLAFALIVNVDAEILVIDEALAVGDVFFQQKCMRFLRNFQKNGGTILFVSHDTSAVMALCQKAILIRRDEKGYTHIIKGNAKDVCQDYLKDLYDDPTRLQSNEQHLTLPTRHKSSDVVQRTVNGDMSQICTFYISEFNSNAPSFGQGGGKIINALFLDNKGNKVINPISGQEVTLVVSIKADLNIEFPAVGIILKDKKGQFIFTESTDPHFRENIISMSPGEDVEVNFRFKMPVLIRGAYSMDIAFANGIGDEHYQLQWLHDAIAIECVTGRQVHGILGFDELSISWNIL